MEQVAGLVRTGTKVLNSWAQNTVLDPTFLHVQRSVSPRRSLHPKAAKMARQTSAEESLLSFVCVLSRQASICDLFSHD